LVAQSVETVQTVDLDYDRVGAALGIDPATLRDVGADLPAAVASTGERVLLVPVNFLSSLSGVGPDHDAIAMLCTEHDVAGVYAFTFDTLSAEATLHARAFTGDEGREHTLGSLGTATAAGACGAYLQGADAFDDPPAETVIEQGHFRDRASRIHVRAGDDPVLVGGQAVTSLDGQLVVPDADDDEIVEA
jgi:PhzF family phenazine biosynthesis protein